MPISVELQPMFQYSLLFVIIAFAIVLLIGIVAVIIFILSFLKKGKPAKAPKVKPVASPPEKKPVVMSLVQAKGIYLSKLDQLNERYNRKEIDNRRAHQELSLIARGFVNEVTGIEVLNLTLEEISRLNMPFLADIIDACYVPEFAEDEPGDVTQNINKARMVIREWN